VPGFGNKTVTATFDPQEIADLRRSTVKCLNVDEILQNHPLKLGAKVSPFAITKT
jgi:hypothetical protein